MSAEQFPAEEHTPGPWRYEPGGGHAYNCIRGAESVQVSGRTERINGISNASYSDRICENLGDINLPGPAANVRLIIAAPALLALARQYASECAECGGSGIIENAGRECGQCNDIRAVIAKATGHE